MHAVRACHGLLRSAVQAPKTVAARSSMWQVWPEEAVSFQAGTLCGCRSLRALSSQGDGSSLLRHIAEKGHRDLSKVTVDELLALVDASTEDRLEALEEALHVGISRIVVLLQDLPLGFSSTGPIRSVIEDYVQDVNDLNKRSGPRSDMDGFIECLQHIFTRHRGMLTTIAKGLSEFQQEITSGYEPFAEVTGTLCADVSDTVPALQKIEEGLDEFFTIRATLRILIVHCITLESRRYGEAAQKIMDELLVRVPDGLREERRNTEMRYNGAVCVNASPSLILKQAYRHARLRCLRETNRCSELLINDIPCEEYTFEDTHFPYVDIHLYFVFFEVVKNALISSVLKAGPDEEPPPIHASLMTGTSLFCENERTVKITDSGEGIQRMDRTKVWSYFYSTRRSPQPHKAKFCECGNIFSPDSVFCRKCEKLRPGAAEMVPTGVEIDDNLESVDSGDMQTTKRFIGRGLGLPISRTLVRYFGGEVDINSIPRKGTDVYIYI